MTTLDDLRNQMRDVDVQLVDLVATRNALARRIGTLKREQGLPLQNFEVERTVHERWTLEATKRGVAAETAQGIARLLIASALHAQEADPAHKVQPTGRRALIIGGAGGMGQWFCRFLEEQGFDVFVDDPKPTSQRKAQAKDGPFDLILVATPPSQVPRVLQGLVPHLTPHVLLADVASVKGEASRHLKAMAAQGHQVVSLHPMFGPRTQSLAGRNVLVLDAGNAEATTRARELFGRTAAQTPTLNLATHDALMGHVLTLAHATALAFNHALSTGGRPFAELDAVASTTFRGLTDIGRNVAQENPKLYYEIQTLNEASLPVLGRLEAAVGRLRSLVENRDERRFDEFMVGPRSYYEGSA